MSVLNEMEKEYYCSIKNKLVEVFSSMNINCHLEITANGKFSEKIKSIIPRNKDIIFGILKNKTSPDITGYVKGKHSSDFIVIEIKEKKIKVDDFYQLKKYKDLFGAMYAFLITLEPIPEEIKRLDKALNMIATNYSYLVKMALIYFSKNSNEFEEWYPKNPFK